MTEQKVLACGGRQLVLYGGEGSGCENGGPAEEGYAHLVWKTGRTGVFTRRRVLELIIRLESVSKR